MAEQKCYTITEAIKILKLSRQSIYTWIDNGQLKANQLPNGTWRIPASEIDKYTK